MVLPRSCCEKNGDTVDEHIGGAKPRSKAMHQIDTVFTAVAPNVCGSRGANNSANFSKTKNGVVSGVVFGVVFGVGGWGGGGVCRER